MATKHGKHVRVQCVFCHPVKDILRFRHVEHVLKTHQEEFKKWYRQVGKHYPCKNGWNTIGEQMVNIDEQMVNRNFSIEEKMERAQRKLKVVAYYVDEGVFQCGGLDGVKVRQGRFKFLLKRGKEEVANEKQEEDAQAFIE